MKSNMKSRQVLLMSMMNPHANYVVRRMNANGSFSKKRPSEADFCQTKVDAQIRVAMLEKMNPHKQYAIDELKVS